MIIGLLLALAAGAALALSMVVQRYALSADPRGVVVCGVACPPNVLWFFGLVGYGAANGLYVAALRYAPLTLAASVFTSLLVFNCIFARFLLNETLTPPKLAGCGLIVAGVCLVVLGSPREADVRLTAGDVVALLVRVGAESRWDWFHAAPRGVAATHPRTIHAVLSRKTEFSQARPVGATYVACLVSAVLASVAAIRRYEARYPLARPRVVDDDETKCDPEDGPVAKAVLRPPRALDDAMALIYPGSLGLDEAIAHLSMKAAVSMIARCAGGNGTCSGAVVYAFAFSWIGASLATLWWLRTVFARYETTQALPVEYRAERKLPSRCPLVLVSPSSAAQVRRGQRRLGPERTLLLPRGERHDRDATRARPRRRRGDPDGYRGRPGPPRRGSRGSVITVVTK